MTQSLKAADLHKIVKVHVTSHNSEKARSSVLSHDCGAMLWSIYRASETLQRIVQDSPGKVMQSLLLLATTTPLTGFHKLGHFSLLVRNNKLRQDPIISR